MRYIDGNLLAGQQVVSRSRLRWRISVGPLLFAFGTLVLIPLQLSVG
jgi:hypothetical protein